VKWWEKQNKSTNQRVDLSVFPAEKAKAKSGAKNKNKKLKRENKSKKRGSKIKNREPGSGPNGSIWDSHE
jgi:hypothetical protein